MNQMLGEMVETGSGEIFVHSAPSKLRSGFCLLEQKHSHLTACEQATGPPSSEDLNPFVDQVQK